MSIWDYANPKRFMQLTDRVLPWSLALTVLILGTGLIWGYFFTPDDYKQGSTVKILFVHVPAAMMAINAWIMMLLASLIWFIRRHHVSALAARAAAPVGLVFTLIALITGALWGQPMWNTWWEWDPRLTSFLILCLFYLGYIALWSAIEDPDTAADLTAVLCMVGSVFAVLSRYAVKFWNQGLHQDSTILKVGEKDPIDAAYYLPLVACIIGFILLFITLVLIRTRTAIRARRLNVLLARERMEG
ncbi:heme ABC transporter permease [Pseudogemmobacter faecipullorum]|uniref:Heme exporter protein C n=1 Tax=Pseudogemmobacter faecipullorum TaxID=2755041 RepID=A0ABS8CLB7_9RHOB|nr:heme ABC transporter permease [Pseudogemmobacter faecipullorum]MCB5409978.1 heme ABC transporter permease [Pseudogemmobacter faecipullorum]